MDGYSHAIVIHKCHTTQMKDNFSNDVSIGEGHIYNNMITSSWSKPVKSVYIDHFQSGTVGWSVVVVVVFP